MAFFQARGVRLIIYLNDIQLMAQSKELLQSHISLTVNLLLELGFLLNKDKSILLPTTALDFLGCLVDSVAATLRSAI